MVLDSSQNSGHLTGSGGHLPPSPHSKSGDRSQRPSSSSSTEELKAASQAVEQEINVVRALKRLSIGNSLDFDPDLPFNETEYGEVNYLNLQQQQSDEILNDLNNDPYEYDSDSVLSASNKLMWVPANAHPNLAPENFRKHVQSTVNEITEQLNNNRSGELSRRGSLRRSGSRGNSLTQHGRRPSIKQLTEELESLSKMAGLDSTDAITLARTLSSSTLGFTSAEKNAYSTTQGESQSSSVPNEPKTDEMDEIFLPSEEHSQLRRSRWTTYRRGGSGRFSGRSPVSPTLGPEADTQSAEPLQHRPRTPLRGREPLDMLNDHKEISENAYLDHTLPVDADIVKPDLSLGPRTAPPSQNPPPKPVLRRATPSEIIQDKPLPPPPVEKQKLKKKKSYGILSGSSSSAPSSPGGQKKKSSWGWLKDRHSSQSSSESIASDKTDAELPQIPIEAERLSLDSAREQNLVDQKESYSSTGHSRNRHKGVSITQQRPLLTSQKKLEPELKEKEKEPDKETMREATKKSISKLFRRKASGSVSSPEISPAEDIPSDYERVSPSLEPVEPEVISRISKPTKQAKSFTERPVDSNSPAEHQRFTLDPRGTSNPSEQIGKPEEPQTPSVGERELLKSTLKIEDRSNRKPNAPLEYTDSAFGFPLPPASQSTLVMLDYRFPIHVERAIYRLSHVKLADARRPLRQQVLLSNFMYAYLNLVNHTLYLQQVPDQANGPELSIEDKMMMGQAELGVSQNYDSIPDAQIYDDEEIYFEAN
ncbi:unnamed protein product [Kuraishia capsulata CBS 1993]|uniref:Protein Zds1 C-terminal domain-containing protein n=1 Tax=Kuraishia capsulata CBS 1993 TaxID=1382522 RepID=W6MUN4_9ASCO|nr:uncharacterized protein KUCA_T00005415001 [Kuraishia capsulata CBS 1993]CDK29427.1 unnamed protein product [Kuraishia capsulata CBS 1993]